MSQILELLEHEVQRILHAHGLKSLNGFAWQDENEPDLVGIAMWELDKPTEPDGDVHSRQVAGEDFCGLMTLARLSIGVALLASNPEPLPSPSDPYYRLHWFNSVVHLSTASDRLRDVLTWTLYSASPKRYKDQLHKAGIPGELRWMQPFRNAREEVLKWRVPDDVRLDLERAAADLATRAERVNEKRKRRNSLIHDLATLDGDLELRRRELDARIAQLESMSVQELIDNQKTHDSRTQKENEAANALLTDWYLDLVHMADAVFQIEHWSRRRRD